MSYKKHAIFVIIVLSVSNYIAPAFSYESKVLPESELNRVMKKIKERETTLKTFTATFKQTNTSELLHEPLYSEGILYFAMDGRILMKVISPSPLMLLIKGNRQIVYYPDISRIEERSFGTTDNIVRRYLHIGESIKTLKTIFEIELVTTPSAKYYHLKMTPKKRDMAKHIRQIDVLVNPRNWLPEQIRFKGKKGDDTTIQLQYKSVNEALPSDIFELEMPKDNNTSIKRKRLN